MTGLSQGLASKATSKPVLRVLAMIASVGAALLGLATISPASASGPTPGAWTPTGSRPGWFGGGFSTTLLAPGKVLIAGGATTAPSASVYDPQTGTWSTTGAPIGGQQQHTAVLLANGQVLIAGGSGGVGGA